MGEFNDFVRTVDKTVDHVRSRRAIKYSNFALTQAGREKAEEYGGGGLEWEVMNHLLENGACTLREVSDGVHVEEKKVKVALERLVLKQRVIKVAR